MAGIPEIKSDDSVTSDSSENVYLARKIHRLKALQTGVPHENEKISELQSNSNKCNAETNAKKIIDSSLKNFRALENTCTEILESKQHNGNGQEDNRSFSLSTKKYKQKRQRKKTNKTISFRHIVGCLFGPLKEQSRNAKPPIKYDRNGIPVQMIEHARRDCKRKRIQEQTLRRVRLSHMGYTLPPSKYDSSDSESLQNVKRLALTRTPYFLVPTIRINQIQKKNRFRNVFLRNDRLNRINSLLIERSTDKGASEDVKSVEINQPDTNQNLRYLRDAGDQINFKTSMQANTIKKKFNQLIADTYAEYRDKYEPSEQNGSILTYDEFKRKQCEGDQLVVGGNDGSQIQLNRNDEAKCQLANETKSIVKKLFTTRRLCQRRRKSDGVDGPLYIDSQIIFKRDNPKQCKLFPMKFVAALLIDNENICFFLCCY